MRGTPSGGLPGVAGEQVPAAGRFTGVVAGMLGDGVGRFVEVGPGKVLVGIVKRMNKEVKLANVEDPASLDAALEVLK